MNQDPLEFEAGDSNLYRYVFNDPTQYIDPSGELIVALIILGAVAGSILLWPPEANVGADQPPPPNGPPPQVRTPGRGRPIEGALAGGFTVIVITKGGMNCVIGGIAGFLGGMANEAMNVANGKQWNWNNVQASTIAGFYGGGVGGWVGGNKGAILGGGAAGIAGGAANWNPQPPHGPPQK